jgi:hypothetical protein
LLTAALPAGFDAGLAGLFLRAFRAAAGGAALARAGTDGFDFAAIFSAIFFGLATALAMTADIRDGERRCAPYTTFGRFRARREARFNATDEAT